MLCVVSGGEAAMHQQIAHVNDCRPNQIEVECRLVKYSEPEYKIHPHKQDRKEGDGECGQ